MSIVGKPNRQLGTVVVGSFKKDVTSTFAMLPPLFWQARALLMMFGKVMSLPYCARLVSLMHFGAIWNEEKRGKRKKRREKTPPNSRSAGR
jgi:hypothetical protein